MTPSIKTVHTIFKTHLDLGFTDLAQNVVTKYFTEYIPQALHTSETLRANGRPERFIWTTGAWLIYEYLERASSGQRRRMEAAIEAGDITWHALPFTLHSELLDASLFRYGLRFSQVLDQRFGKRTIAGKMTDVPGHTRAIIPLLAEAGVQFLHIGVNEASTMPQVPPIFVWRDEDGAEIIVMYQHSYGGPMVCPGMTEAITFAHTHDNIGPQTPEQVYQAFAGIRQLFPETEVKASTLDAFAEALLPFRTQLPAVTQELGDTWIHGVGSDPKKVSQYRELLRLRRQWLAGGEPRPDEAMLERFSRNLLFVAEHTWGMDMKTFLADYENYRRVQFEGARTAANFVQMSESWTEQRAYVERAVQSLGSTSFASEARRRLAALEPALPPKDGFERIGPSSRSFTTAHFVLEFDAHRGAISQLIAKSSGRPWATPDRLMGLVRYQTFAQADYDRFLDQYLVRRPSWAEPDFSKPGLALGAGESRWWQPQLSELFYRKDEEGYHFILEMELTEAGVDQYGAPKRFTLSVDAPEQVPALYLTLQWWDKPANRQPEALWFSFCPQAAQTAVWTMEKMGKMISPLDVVPNGNRKLHAVGSGVFYRDDNAQLHIETLDAPLVAPGEPSLLNFNSEQPPLENGMHFNLYNNVWGTNFPLWYDENGRFRFVLRFS